MKTVLFLKGLPASGKSTYAKKLVDDHPGKYKRISKDDLRAMVDNGRWSKSNEKFILNVRDNLILLALQEGYHPIVDDTNLHPKHEQAIRELVKGQATVEVKDFTDVPLETCIERDRHRANYVGEQVIRKMYRDFLQVAPPVINDDPKLPKAIICDLDGTLAVLNGRNPYDAAKCEQDLVNEHIATIVRFYSQTVHVLLVSGRKESHRPQTMNWLAQHTIPYTSLWMRQDDDNRKDSLVKEDIYREHIQGKYAIQFCLDDRNSVVDLWRSLGLICLQVADGDF
ncbi:hypothetical protein KDA_59270 [Dictyobacter alpinus]|uniref:Polynucleotide kinase PNKP phosphatase domain-containing protein n=1 Tax=Dictyobacter alpinus TaxID=2014873 RepID=A0A402BGF6_9CHLR|nr:AAA family ATPase [Dictyobacter alpinus]GCE30443.1 hypothetical protein KDA_59270 [Dictyobacter alpinus]